MRQKLEARREHKTRWAYRTFLYEAEHAGITATGEADWNELLPPTLAVGSRGLPAGVTHSCLELYREFRADPDAFAARLEQEALAAEAETMDAVEDSIAPEADADALEAA